MIVLFILVNWDSQQQADCWRLKKQPSEFHQVVSSGPDGIRTRDLGLDRAACLAATPRVQERAEYTIGIFRRQGAPLPKSAGSVGV